MSTRESNDDRIALAAGNPGPADSQEPGLRSMPWTGHCAIHSTQSEEVFLVEHGSLYVALQRLEDKNWIRAKWGVSENNRKARFYSLTAKGREQLAGEDQPMAAADASGGSDSGCQSRAAIRGGMSMFRRKRSCGRLC